jgi:hypothetical protein
MQPASRPAHEVPGKSVREVELGSRPVAAARPFNRADAPSTQRANASRGLHDARGPGDRDRPNVIPPHRTNDVRYNRPSAHHVRPAAHAHDRPPVQHHYRSWYTRWYCHPWYRYQYSTVAVVWFGFDVHPWIDWWVPPSRLGYVWVPGQYVYGVWWPGYWAPVGAAPYGYAYVEGWWEDDVYVDGYWRSEGRDGWVWVDGYYLEDGGYVRGHWAPETETPEGYVWEAGFWDGEEWVDGFWRPEFRDGYVWVSSYYDQEGIFHGGYWSPLEDRPGFVWIPGWFDGNGWVEGYWVDEREITEEALQQWTPPEGVDDGWDEEPYYEPDYAVPGDEAPPAATIIEKYRDEYGEDPLAIPVIPEE